MRMNGALTGLALLLAFIVLAVGTVSVFLAIDSTSHSASDTLRPFLLTMLPVWGVAIWATAVILRGRSFK